jgi:tetrapyrrole methylase family protein/MazG family protein
MTITIVGLGPGDPAQLTREAWDVLSKAGEVHVRTARHPTLAGLPAGLAIHSFDDIYDSVPEFERVYAAIAEHVVALGKRPGGVVYAVPGHPAVGEATVGLIQAQAAAAGVPVRIVAGLSFVEPVLTALQADALPNLQIADALDLAARHHPSFHPDAPALVAQLYSAAIAGDVKLTLMNQYPDDHGVALVHAVGTAEQAIERLPLFEIDRSPHIAHLTALYVPPLPVPSAFETLQETVAYLRAPDGCPWDREQTHESLRANLLEETYEVLEAIDLGDAGAMREEFGDLLLQVVLQSQIALEAGEFSLAEVVAGINAKLVRRHPHVFGDVKVSGVGQVLENWEKLKAAERGGSEKPDKGTLGTVPPGLPALLQAETYQRRAARVGFDWPDASGVRAKVDEEIAEVAESEDADGREDEMGDLLFAVVNWARWLEVDPEAALRRANGKFARRFSRMEAAVREQGRPMDQMTLAELDQLWEAAKAAEAATGS